MRNGKSSAGGGSATIDYADVAHTTVTTPVAAGKYSSGAAAKRKQQAMGKGGGGGKEGAPAAAAAPATAGRGGDKENQRRNGRGGGGGAAAAAEDEKKKATKRAKTDSAHPPSQPSSSDAAAAAAAATTSTNPSSVRYPRPNYSEAIPPSDRTFLSLDISDADKLLYLATRVMETDTLGVEHILLSTKYHHLAQEMGKFSDIITKRLKHALAADAAQEAEENKILKRLKMQKEEGKKECDRLEEEAGRLRREVAQWEGMEREVQAEEEEEGREGGKEGGGWKKKVEAIRKEEEAREEAAMAAMAAAAATATATAAAPTRGNKRKSSSSSSSSSQQQPFPSPVMEETSSLLSQGPSLRAAALENATKLIDTLEQSLLPSWQDKEEEGREKQKELAAAFHATSFAGLPSVGAPGVAARKVVGGGGGGGGKKK